MKDLIISLIFLLIAAIFIYRYGENKYSKGFEAGKAYTPPAMSRIDSLTIPEFTPAERRIITQFMLVMKRAAEVKE